MVYAVVRWVLGVVFRFGWRPRIEGVEHVPLEGPVLVASNHLSFVDSVVIPLAVPRRVHFLAKSEYFEGTGLRGWLSRAYFTSVGAVPVRRGEHADARASLQAALGVLRDGDAFGIYPEGTRSRDGRLYRGRTGVAWLALDAGAPVVPVGLVGTDRVQPVGARGVRVAPVTVRFGPPVRPEPYRDLRPGVARRRLTDAVMDAIAALSGQQRAAGYNERPPED